MTAIEDEIISLHADYHVPASQIDKTLGLIDGTARRVIVKDWARKPEDASKTKETAWDN